MRANSNIVVCVLCIYLIDVPAPLTDVWHIHLWPEDEAKRAITSEGGAPSDWTATMWMPRMRVRTKIYGVDGKRGGLLWGVEGDLDHATPLAVVVHAISFLVDRGYHSTLEIICSQLTCSGGVDKLYFLIVTLLNASVGATILALLNCNLGI